MLDFVAAGASAVSLGTVLFSDPFAAHRVRGELGRESGSRGPASASETDRIAHVSASGQSLSPE